MSSNSNNSAPDSDMELRRLGESIDELVNTITHLKNENRTLKAQQEALLQERAKLMEKNETARNRVEAMIVRLKALETNQ